MTYDNWKATDLTELPEPANEETELEIVHQDLQALTGDLERVKQALDGLRAAVDDYYDVDDGIPNIPGNIMARLGMLRLAIEDAGRSR